MQLYKPNLSYVPSGLKQVNNIFLRHQRQERERMLLAAAGMRSCTDGAMRVAATERSANDLNDLHFLSFVFLYRTFVPYFLSLSLSFFTHHFTFFLYLFLFFNLSRSTKDLNDPYGSKLQRRTMVVLSLQRGKAYSNEAFYKRGEGSVAQGVKRRQEDEKAWTLSVSDRQVQSPAHHSLSHLLSTAITRYQPLCIIGR